VCVYNNEIFLKASLLKSLKSQTSKHELILIDNTQGQFKSASEALNYGGGKANGKYIMFSHQDIDLGSSLWLEKAEQTLDCIPELGIAGIAGISEEGNNYAEKRKGYISDSGTIWGKPFNKPEIVQTIDECLLIIPKTVFNKLQFDEKTFDDWHCYGSDYCLSTRQMGLKAYVIPSFAYHRSLGVNAANLLRYQKRLYRKHGKNNKRIFTTCGEISPLLLSIYSIIKCAQPLYRKLFPGWIKSIRRELSDCNTVLDLGCGYKTPLQQCNVSYSTGVDLFTPYLEESKGKSLHNQYIRADIMQVQFKPESFDAVVAFEVLEHLTKQEGYELLSKMKTWARKKLIITTPNGYLWQDGYDSNPLQEHKTGWNSGELNALGFKVYGMTGWKKLAGYKGTVKYKPLLLWETIFSLTHKITYRHPTLAFQLLAIKKLPVSNDITITRK